MECEQTLEYAREQLIDGLRQEHYNDIEYTNAQQMLEDRYNELMAIDPVPMPNSANG